MGLRSGSLQAIEIDDKPLRLYRYTFQTPIGEFLMLIDDEGAVRLSNWTDREGEIVFQLRRAYEPREIVIEDPQVSPSNSNNTDTNNIDSSCEDLRVFAVRQMQLYFSYSSFSGNAKYSCGGSAASISATARQTYLQSLLSSVSVRCPPSTQFTRCVWAALRSVAAGELTTYGALAVRCGRPRAARAVGRAMRENQLCVFLPCHRVVGATQKLVGFSSGISRKAWLLKHEGAALLEDQLQRVTYQKTLGSRKRSRS